MDKKVVVTTAQLITKTVNGMNTVKSTKPGERNQLIDDIRRAVVELENIRRYFEIVEDPELIDYAIYREKAALLQLSYLLKKAKKNPQVKYI